MDKQELIDLFTHISVEKTKLQQEYERITTTEIERYRNLSARRVIKFLQENQTKLSEKAINTYLCHCANKLCGNIDGIEIDLTINETDESNG